MSRQITTWPLSSSEYLAGPNIYARNSSWSKESAMRAYFTIKLGLARSEKLLKKLVFLCLPLVSVALTASVKATDTD